MINVKDIRIGDYFRVNRDGLCIKKGTVVEVRGIDADDKLTKKGLIGSTHCRPLDKEQFDGGIWCDYLDPIPLTAEILEKNGFKRSEVFVEWKYENDNVYMIYKPFPYLKIQMEERIVAFPCEYIHQLQHALRPCGIEKEIKL